MKLLRATKYRQLLAVARQRASLTQPQLADKVGTRVGFVAKYEDGVGKGPSRRR
jgi:ribosome-binding protein aMBF1 (putative translation factor)